MFVYDVPQEEIKLTVFRGSDGRMTSSPKPSISLIKRLASDGFFSNAEYGDLNALQSPKDFSIREAEETEIERLCYIESECWDAGLRADKNLISKRLKAYPSGCWVVCVKGDRLSRQVVGVMYTQTISSRSSLLEGNIKHGSQEDAFCKGGKTLQLLSVAVLPQYAHQQLGGALRDFVLQCARLEGFEDVIAMTRCSEFTGGNNADYEKYVASHTDPTIMFHEQGGAEVVEIAAAYREKDVKNLGNSIMISYYKRLWGVGVKEQKFSRMIANLDLKELLRLVASVLHVSLDDVIGKFEDTPFMDLGLDSLKMMELRGKLGERLGAGFPLSPTALFDYPTPRRLVQYINGERDNRLLRSSDRKNENFGNDDIAICGMSCRFPGSGMSPEEYFEALLSATDATREVPAEWKGAVGTTKAGFLDDYVAEMFDAGFFGLSQEEIRMANPHQRLLLEVGHEALVNAGLAEEQVGRDTAEDKQNNVGVYVGLCNNEWIPSEKDRKSPYASMNHAGASAANRLSFLLHLQGPSMVIDTACSSSLVAVHTACQALKTGDCDAALVASADLMVSPYSLMTRSAAGMLSEDGINRTFDAAANGYVRGEGAGAIVLKRLRDVEREPSSSPILAVIRSSSVNQDGRSATFMAPNGEAQKELLLQSLEKARVQPSDVSYIETHGTGTPFG